MAPSDKNEIYLSSSPHYSSGITTSRIMLVVILTLLPIAASGIYYYGIPALVTILVSVASCVVFEALFRMVTKQPRRVKDFSAVVTGLLLALVLPPALPWWMTMLGGLFSVVIAKEFFGGLGANVFNPALAGRAFLLMSFATAMTTWAVPGMDGVTGATALATIQQGGSVTDVAANMGSNTMGEFYLSMFFGNRGGSIGESSIMLILLACIVLIATKVIDWRAPLAMVVTAVAITWIGGVDPVVTLLSGGLLFGAVFMTTDYATSPVTPAGRLLFGFGCGLITALIRLFGGYPEGVMFSILIMNAIVPFLNKIITRKYGYVKAKKEKAAK